MPEAADAVPGRLAPEASHRLPPPPEARSPGPSLGGKRPCRGPDLGEIGTDPVERGEIPWHLVPARVRGELNTVEVFKPPGASRRAAEGDFATSSSPYSDPSATTSVREVPPLSETTVNRTAATGDSLRTTNDTVAERSVAPGEKGLEPAR